MILSNWRTSTGLCRLGLVYSKKLGGSTGMDRYLVYDPNHPGAPRELTWFSRTRAFAYQKDWDFIGGFVRVYQVYGKPLQ